MFFYLRSNPPDNYPKTPLGFVLLFTFIYIYFLLIGLIL